MPASNDSVDVDTIWAMTMRIMVLQTGLDQPVRPVEPEIGA